MLSGPVAESELGFHSKLPTFSEEKNRVQVKQGATKVGTECDGFRTQDLDANTEFRHSAFSRAVSVWPFEVRGWRGSLHQKQI